MSERYSRLFTLPENLYAVGSPVVIAAGTLLKDNQTGKIVAQLKLRSISNKTIKAVKVKLDLLDTAGNPLAESVEHDYLDLNVSRDVEFGQKNPVMVPNVKARSYTASVVEVVFVDRSIWTADGNAWEPLSKPQLLCLDIELLKQYRIRFGQSSTYIPKEEKDLWYCTCGTLNHLGEGCHCGNSLFELQAVDMVELAEEKDARLAQEREVSEAKAAAEKAAIEVAKKKTAKILKIVIPVICTLIAFVILLNSVIIPNSKYNKAVSLMDAGQYEEAIAAFEAMDGYKDSAEQIVNCENSIVAAEQARIEAEMAEEFAHAEELLASGDYDGAIAIFKALTDFDGSEEGIAAAKESKKEAAYKAANALVESKRSGEAAIAFAKLNDYQDAHQRSLELWNSVAVRNTLDTGRFHTVGLKNDGTMLAVGFNQYGQCDIDNWKDIVAVSAGGCFTIGLKADGTVVSAGANEEGQCDVQNWNNIVAVSAGEYHTVGLKADGRVVATGWNKYGQCNVQLWTDIVAISAGQYHTVALKSDGTVVSVGWNEHGQRNIDNWKDIIAVAAGTYHTVGLQSNGNVVVVGNNSASWFDVGFTSSKGGFIATTNSENKWCNVNDWTDIVAIEAGAAQTIGIRSDGTAIAVGDNVHGRCDVGNWTNIVAVSTRNIHTVGLKSDGTAVIVGSNEDGQCDITNWTNIKLPN